MGLAGALIVVLLVLSSVYIIPETHRGVKLRFGELVETDMQAGLHFKVPVIDQIREFDIRVLTMDLPSRQYLTVEKKPRGLLYLLEDPRCGPVLSGDRR